MYHSGLLCFNYSQIEVLNERTRSLKDSISYAILREQWRGTKLPGKKGMAGKKVLARTRSYIADMWGVSLSTATRRLCRFKAKGFITGAVGMWYGDKRLCISCEHGIDAGINVKKLNCLTGYTGSHEASFILSFLGFVSQKDYWITKGERWFMMSKAKLSRLATVDSKTCDAMMRDLVKRGCIEYRVENALGENRSERHYVVHVKSAFEAEFAKAWKALKEKELADKMEKMTLSITVDKLNEGYINNNTASASNPDQGTVIFSRKIQNYVAAAISNTLVRCTHKTFDAVTLLAHVKYVLTCPGGGSGMKNFVHIVNKVMFLVRKAEWKVPFGFYKYCEEGRKMADEQKDTTYVFKKQGPGTVQAYDYGVQLGKDQIPSRAAILIERKRLQSLVVDCDEVNRALQEKFGYYAEPSLLRR